MNTLDEVLDDAANSLRAAVVIINPDRRAFADPGLRRRRGRLLLGVCLGLGIVAVSAAVFVRIQADQLTRIAVPGLVEATTTMSSEVATPAATTGGAAVAPPVDETPLAPLAAPVNLLVVGTDVGVIEGQDAGRSDAIMVVRIEPAARRIALLSVPRDLWITTRAGSHARINTLDAPELVQTVSGLLGIDINHYISIDFAGFRDLIDLVGGVSVPFAEEIRDERTGFSAALGCNHLDGGLALAYLRARSLQVLDPVAGGWKVADPTSSLGRDARQRDFVSLALGQILIHDYSATNLARILTQVVDHMVVDTGLDVDGLRSLFDTARLIGAGNTESFALDSAVASAMINGNSVLVADAARVRALGQAFISGQPASDAGAASGTAMIGSPSVACS